MHVNVLVKTQNIGMQQIEDRQTDKDTSRDKNFLNSVEIGDLLIKPMAKNDLFANVVSFSVGLLGSLNVRNAHATCQNVVLHGDQD